MATSGPAPVQNSRSSEEDDPLMYLPCSTIVEYPRAGIIYAPGQPCTNIYVVIAGIIQVARVADNVPPVIVDVYRTDDFFGEGALIKLPARFEQAQALEKSMLMTWQAADVERMQTGRDEPREQIAGQLPTS